MKSRKSKKGKDLGNTMLNNLFGAKPMYLYVHGKNLNINPSYLRTVKKMSPLSRLLKSNALFALMLLLSPFVIGYTYGLAFPPAHQQLVVPRRYLSYYFYANPLWTIGETLSIDVYVSDAEDVCLWQAELVYDPYSLVVLNVASGDFLSSKTLAVNSTQLFYSSNSEELSLPDANAIGEYSILCYATDVAPGMLLICGCRFDLRSVSGSGKVATITFGVWSHAKNNLDVSVGETMFLDANLAETTKGSITIDTT
jgi:hypothetical protein